MGVVLLVRHGQASFGADDYDVLSPTGWDQGRVLGAWLAHQGVVPTTVVRGGMRRHRETVEAMCAGAGWDLTPETDPAWDEFDHEGVLRAQPGPSYAGDDRREFQRVFERSTWLWASDDGSNYPEPYADFLARVRGAQGRAAAGTGSGGTTVVVTSGGPIGVVCADLSDPDVGDVPGTARRWARFNSVLVNSSVTRVVVGSTGARLLTFNEHAHLAPEMRTYR